MGKLYTFFTQKMKSQQFQLHVAGSCYEPYPVLEQCVHTGERKKKKEKRKKRFYKVSSARLLADLKLLCDKERASLVAAYLPNETFLAAKHRCWLYGVWVWWPVGMSN